MLRRCLSNVEARILPTRNRDPDKTPTRISPYRVELPETVTVRRRSTAKPLLKSRQILDRPRPCRRRMPSNGSDDVFGPIPDTMTPTAADELRVRQVFSSDVEHISPVCEAVTDLDATPTDSHSPTGNSLAIPSNTSSITTLTVASARVLRSTSRLTRSFTKEALSYTTPPTVHPQTTARLIRSPTPTEP